MNHHAVDFLHTLCDQHLILLIVAHDGVGDLVVSDQRIDIAVGGHVVLDLLIGRIARLQVFARIVFRWFQLLDWHLLQLHIRLVQKAKASLGIRRTCSGRRMLFHAVQASKMPMPICERLSGRKTEVNCSQE